MFPSFVNEMLKYDSTGIGATIETILILILVVFLGWLVKLFLEPDDNILPIDMSESEQVEEKSE